MTTSLSSCASDRLELGGLRVTLMGLGRHGGGLGAARFLAAQGVRLTISDTASADLLTESLIGLRDYPEIQLRLGGHDPADFSSADVIVVNPAVRPDHPCLQEARAAGVSLTSEIELFLERCPAHVIGVSGSNGKSTTCTMLFGILKRAGRRAWLGGNIGGSLLNELDHMTADDVVVLELSSFQLAHLSAKARLPEIAVLTNLSPNHLDWHDGFKSYTGAKQRLLWSEQVILNTHDPVLASWALQCPARVPPLTSLNDLPSLRVPGKHNRRNAACAAAAASAIGVDWQSIHEALADFTGLEHRIEFVAEIDGRHFFNDSKSTSPAAAIAALKAMNRRTWLLLGGVSKGTEFHELAARAAERACGVAVFGAARHELAAASCKHAPELPLANVQTLDEAFAWCCSKSRSGDAILLSPACASFDQYADFTARGEHFRERVRAIS